MQREIHRLITEEALQGKFTPAALAAVIFGNVQQDRPAGQVWHPEYHFDSNTFKRGLAYMETNRVEVTVALEHDDRLAAWHAFGRLTHAGQDLYAHSNYVTLWLERFSQEALPAPEAIDPLDAALLSGKLASGKIYLLEPFSWIPALRRYVLPLMPRDSHAWMNLDSSAQGYKFAYARAAAVKRTVYEYEKTLALIPNNRRPDFFG